jgi:hypothetical protein
MLAGINRQQRKAPWISYVNLPTVGAFLTLFGVAGYLLARYSSLGLLGVVIISLLIGAAGAGGTVAVIAGWAVPAAAREIIDERYVLQGNFGRVVRAITGELPGEISYEVDKVKRTVTALSLDGGAIPEGAEIVIERVENGVAYVERWSTIARQLELPSEPSGP